MNIDKDYTNKILKIAKNFHCFCENEDLSYFAIGGTLIGAVRHEGIIPWDDDIDIGMPRADYNKFLERCKRFPDEFVVEEYSIRNNSVYPFIKIYDKNSTVIENKVEPVKRGVWIDIFPLDGISSISFISKLHFLLVRFFFMLWLHKSYCYEYGRSRIKNKIKRVLSILLLPIPKSIIYILMTKLSSFKKYNESYYGVNFFGRWGYKEIFRKSLFEDRVLFDFNDFKLYGPIGYDAYLKKIYGNYMIPPENKKYYMHNIEIISLTKGWEE